MIKITYVDSGGDSEQTVDAESSSTVMEAALMGNVAGILAECGGSCCCATCHVYVDEPWLSLVEPPAPEELDLLENLESAQPNSRLSCQLSVHAGLDGLVVRTPSSQG